MQCHQGRRASGDVEAAIAGLEEDAVSGALSFVNVHYYIAAATWLGAEARGGFEYPDRSYTARFEHVPDLQACVECHDPHSQAVAWQTCSPCHVAVSGFADLRAIRVGNEDFDGDGDVEEGIYGEIETMQGAVYAAIQAYASQVVGTPIAYADDSPYFVVDTNGNGRADPGEISGGNAYAAWTPRLLRAAYNYHFSLQDRGNYAHNGRYVLQLLHDSLDDLGRRVSMDAGRPLRPASR
jgi:hypothetical protein